MVELEIWVNPHECGMDLFKGFFDIIVLHHFFGVMHPKLLLKFNQSLTYPSNL